MALSTLSELTSYLSRKVNKKQSSKNIIEGITVDYFADCTFQKFRKECLDTTNQKDLVEMVGKLKKLQTQAKTSLIELIKSHKQQFLKIAVGTKGLASSSQNLSKLLQDMLTANQEQIIHTQSELQTLAELRLSKERIVFRKKGLLLIKNLVLLKQKISARLSEWQENEHPIIL